MNKEQIAQLIASVFGDKSQEAYKTVQGENQGWDPTATNTNRDGSIDTGIFQINSKTFEDFYTRKKKLLQANGINSYADMTDPGKNAKMARIVYNEQGWNAWYGSPLEQRQGRPNEPLLRNVPLDVTTLTPTPTPTVVPSIAPEQVVGQQPLQQQQQPTRKIDIIRQQANEGDMLSKAILGWYNGTDKAIKGIGKVSTAVKGLLSGLGDFVDNQKITQSFGEKTFGFYGPNGHEGTDYRAAKGNNLYGMKGWKVVQAGQGPSYYGNTIMLQNPTTGEKLEFAHLNDIGVKIGDVIPDDKYIIGHTGNSGARPDGQPEQAHLHVNYYTANGKKSDVTQLADQTLNDTAKKSAQVFPIVPSFDQAIANAKQTIVKPVVAAQPIQPIQQTVPQATFISANKDPKYNGNGYLIKSGDSLSKIAKDLNTTVGTLMAKNNLQDPNKIYSGDVLKY